MKRSQCRGLVLVAIFFLYLHKETGHMKVEVCLQYFALLQLKLDIVSKHLCHTEFFLGVSRPLPFDETMHFSQELLLFVGLYIDFFVFFSVFSVHVLVYIIR